jgi:hypothetical protein
MDAAHEATTDCEYEVAQHLLSERMFSCVVSVVLLRHKHSLLESD